MAGTTKSPPTSVDRRILFLVASARHGGNTEWLARLAADRLGESVAQRWLHLDDHRLPRFEDLRHDSSRVYEVPSGGARTLLDATLAATDIVMVAPLYWYGLPASAKLYLDHWSGWMRLAVVDFRARMAGKTLRAITMVSEEDRRVADPLIATLRLTADYMAMKWGGALVGYGNRPGDVAADTSAVVAATAFFSDLSGLSVDHGRAVMLNDARPADRDVLARAHPLAPRIRDAH